MISGLYTKILQAKREFFIIRRAFFKTECGWEYLYYRFLITPKILGRQDPIGRPQNQENLAVHILVCARDFGMTLWSLLSFYHTHDIYGHLYIHSDGTLHAKHKKILSRLFPSATYIDPDVFEESFQTRVDVPEEVRAFRLEQKVVFLKKLVDPHFVSQEACTLIIDPDLIWFKDLRELGSVVSGEDKHAYMMDGQNINKVWFKHDEELPDELSRFNGGLILYRKEQLDLEKLGEFFSRIDMHKKQLFIGQSGHAYALDNLLPLPEQDYVVKGVVTKKTRMKHYTSPQREHFFTKGVAFLSKLDI